MRYQIARILFVLKRLLAPAMRGFRAFDAWLNKMAYRYLTCPHSEYKEVPWGDHDTRRSWESALEIVSETTRHDHLLGMGWHGKHERCTLCGRNYRTWEPA